MPSSQDAVDPASWGFLNAALECMTAAALHPPGDECALPILKVGRELHRVGIGVGRGRGLPHRTILALIDDVDQGRVRSDVPESLREALESLVVRACFIEHVADYVDDLEEVVSHQRRLLAELQRDAASLAPELLALAATVRVRGNAELACLMEAAARRLAGLVSPAAVEVGGVSAPWASQPDPPPPTQVLPGHPIWPHGPPSGSFASSRERVASEERRALVST